MSAALIFAGIIRAVPCWVSRVSRTPDFAGFSDFFDAVGQFFGNLADIRWVALALGLLCFGTYLTIRSRAFYN